MTQSNLKLFSSEIQPEDEGQNLPERFLSYIFHELRTPLTVVHSYAQIGLDKLPPDPEFDRLRKIMSRMINQGEETVEMIEELLEAARIPLGTLNLDQVEIEFAQLVEDSIEHLPDELRARVTFNATGEPSMIVADPPRIERVLSSLVKFSLNEQTARGFEAQLNLLYQNQARNLILKLEAPHLEFDAAEQETLFDLYRPVRQKNSLLTKAGLLDIGLYVARGIIEAHHGKLDYSEELPGFIINLPLYTGANS